MSLAIFSHQLRSPSVSVCKLVQKGRADPIIQFQIVLLPHLHQISLHHHTYPFHRALLRG